MMDIKSQFHPLNQSIDYSLGVLGLTQDDGLESKIIISLFTDKRVSQKEVELGEDVRGFWGNTFTGKNIGSKLWLLKRSTINQTTLNLARQYTLDALGWLIKEKIAQSIDVTSTAISGHILGLIVIVDQSTFSYYVDL